MQQHFFLGTQSPIRLTFEHRRPPEGLSRVTCHWLHVETLDNEPVAQVDIKRWMMGDWCGLSWTGHDGRFIELPMTLQQGQSIWHSVVLTGALVDREVGFVEFLVGVAGREPQVARFRLT